MRLKGHETFIMREGWLNKGLMAVAENPKVFSENYGADALGVGSSMAKAIRYWLRESGFIQEKVKEGARLTNLGRMVLENDKYIEDLFTLWIFHANLVCNRDNATSFYLTFNELEAEEFTREELTVLLREKLLQFPEVTTISERSLGDDVTAVLNMYVREKQENYDPEDKKISPFAALGLLKKTGTKYQKVQPSQQMMEEVFLYLLQRYWMLHPNMDSISIDRVITMPCLPGKVLNLKRVAVNEYLDRLEAQKYITVNRTAGLDTVYKSSNLTMDQVVANYYKKNK